MLPIFFVTFPFFALVLCGLVATRGRILPLDRIARIILVAAVVTMMT